MAPLFSGGGPASVAATRAGGAIFHDMRHGMLDPHHLSNLELDAAREIRFSEIVSALSYALDITEGQPEGHAVRTCLIGMRIAEELRLPAADLSALYYALLLKDLGCSSNAAKMCYLFGADDRKVKRNLKTVNWARLSETVRFMNQNVMPDGTVMQRALRAVVFALEGPKGPNKIVQVRCERGAAIARQLGLPEATATAILHLDEHWDGKGHPHGLAGDEISLLGRIACLAQTIDAYFCVGGPQAAWQMASDRRGAWFDPQLVDAFGTFADDAAFWSRVGSEDPRAFIAALEPEGLVQMADEGTLDRVAQTFAQVVDAKSPWTFRHSDGVARIAVGIAKVLGLPQETITRIFRAGLLHDIGKLGVSNLILDKPGKLTDEEFVELRRHPDFTQQILSRIGSFSEITAIAATHHERMDGRGYHRGIPAGALPIEARLLVVSDICEALSAKRPYRDELPREKVHAILTKDAGSAVCPECVEALKTYHEQSDVISRVNDQLHALDDVLASV
jgi:HD-GYP domain-containing protein (c-di-GMP phosphodiesterase class II)